MPEQLLEELLRKREAGEAALTASLSASDREEAEAVFAVADRLSGLGAAMPAPEAGLAAALSAAVTPEAGERYAGRESIANSLRASLRSLERRWKTLVPLAALAPVAIALIIASRSEPIPPASIDGFDLAPIVAFADALAEEMAAEDAALIDELSDADFLTNEELNAFANESYGAEL